jgi:RNA polymerase sigma-70 factor (ECF subfamily)
MHHETGAFAAPAHQVYLERDRAEAALPLDVIYEQYRDRVYWYLLVRTGHADDAADLLQQVFLNALKARARYSPERGSVAGWLFAIARNTAATFLSRRPSTVPWDLVPEILVPLDDDDLAAHLLHQEDLRRLRLLVGQLDATKRELLLLRFVAGLTSAEIATILGKSEAAIKKRIARTLHTLKEQYHDAAT